MGDVICVALYALTVVGATWLIGHVGVQFGAGPHLIEVLPGLYAPSGVLLVAARDHVVAG